MSTTFEVYPGINKMPSFCQVLELSNKRLKEFLASIDINVDVAINVNTTRKMGQMPVFIISVLIEKNIPRKKGTDALSVSK